MNERLSRLEIPSEFNAVLYYSQAARMHCKSPNPCNKICAALGRDNKLITCSDLDLQSHVKIKTWLKSLLPAEEK